MEMQQKIMIGKLLRADNTGFVAGCRVADLQTPGLGMLTRVPIENGTEIYGLISNISITDDGLVRQIVSGVNIPTEYTADNRYNRNLPVEISVLAVGFQQEGHLFHLLPPRPPLSLDVIYLCDQEELIRFTSTGHFGYFRHLLRAVDKPVGELLAAHLREARKAHLTAGNSEWFSAALQELITLLRDDYQTLMSVLGALADSSAE
jgi:hypothetical protein